MDRKARKPLSADGREMRIAWIAWCGSGLAAGSMLGLWTGLVWFAG
jgi:hypothetical protein